MTSAQWDDDDALLADLRAALATSDVPAEALASAKAAFTWRTIDEELALASLVFDSSLQDAGGVRGAGPRTLTFEGERLSVEIELNDDTVVGQLIPPSAGRVVVQTAAGTFAECEADEVGCFVLPRPDRGPIRLTCRAGADAIGTPWLPV